MSPGSLKSLELSTHTVHKLNTRMDIPTSSWACSTNSGAAPAQRTGADLPATLVCWQLGILHQQLGLLGRLAAGLALERPVWSCHGLDTWLLLRLRSCTRTAMAQGWKTSCAARGSRGSVQGVLRAPAERATPRGPCCHRLRHARAERRYGGSWQEGGARAASPPLQDLAPRRRAGHAPPALPWEARARAGRVQTAGKNLWVVVGGWWWVVAVVRTSRGYKNGDVVVLITPCAHQLRITSGWLPLIGGTPFIAGKYNFLPACDCSLGLYSVTRKHMQHLGYVRSRGRLRVRAPSWLRAPPRRPALRVRPTHQPRMATVRALVP